ncbi:MAG: peptide ABC transporter substrate-binding protein [Defluviitaleaceae bacterium]|nr:peptide ABC transporter substrate-binding protein [Defluviitaleaceae bacterium]
MKRILAILASIFILSGCATEGLPAVSDLDEQRFIDEEDESLEFTNINLHENLLTLAMRNPLTLNPLLNEDKTVEKILNLMFEHVAVVDSSQRVLPNLAESFEFSEDGLLVTVNLRQDVYFSDGTQLTASDLAFSINFIKNYAPDRSIYKDTVSTIRSVSIINEFTLVVELFRPTGGQAYMFLFPIISEHHYRGETLPNSEANMAPLGTGAYKFENYTLVRELNLVRNDLHFKGRANIEAVRVLIIDDYETKLHAFEQGIIDVITTDILNFSQYSGTRQTIINDFSTNLYDFIGFDFDNIVFQDIRIREAIAHLVNIEQILNNVYLGSALRAFSVINSNSWLFEESLAVREHNTELARNLFLQSGFTDDTISGYMGREASGIFLELDFRILANEESVERVQIANLLSESLYEIGVRSQVIILPFEEYVERLRNSEFDIFVGSFNFSLMPDFTSMFSSSQIGIGNNFFNYRSQALDSYLHSINIAANEESFVRAVSNVQRYIASEIVCISIAFRRQSLVTDNKVRGVKSPVINNVYQDVHLWLIN